MAQRSSAGRSEPAESTVPALVTVASRTRLAVMLLVGVGAAVVTGVASSWRYAPLAGWDVATVVLLAWVWPMIVHLGSTATAAHATREDPGRALTDAIVFVACVASLAAVGVVLIASGSAKGAQQDLLAGLGVVSLVLSWFTVHTLFTLHYARLYYTGTDGGVTFNETARPRYLDFAYLAFTVGMTFQVSDTTLTTPQMRYSVLRQALLSYLFGAVILAATINLVAGLGSSSGG